jgi:hypothetical protein
MVGVSFGKNVRRGQVEQDASEKPEIQPEDRRRDGHQQRDGSTVTGARASATSRVNARRRSFPDSEVMV